MDSGRPEERPAHFEPARACLFSIFFASLFLLAAVPALFALQPGQYTDYIYETDYHAPLRPAPMALDCTFFHQTDPQVCDILDKLNGSVRDQLALGLIRHSNPEENLDWVRYWNSRLPLATYYDNTSDMSAFGTDDGAWGENGSLRDVWFRLTSMYPSVIDSRDGYYYLPDQAIANAQAHIRFVVPNPANGSWCAQEYGIKGYDFELVKSIGNFSTSSAILPIGSLLAGNEKANLTVRLTAAGEWSRNLSAYQNETTCAQGACNVSAVCTPNSSERAIDTLELNETFPIKRYPDEFGYAHLLAVPKSGFANGVINITLPRDFLYYSINVKGLGLTVHKNDIRLSKKGGLYPVLQARLIPSPSREGTLSVVQMHESENATAYVAGISYRLPIDSPNIGESDCTFQLVTPFKTTTIEKACNTSRAIPSLTAGVQNVSDKTARVVAHVTDQLGDDYGGMDVQFTWAGGSASLKTDLSGRAFVDVPLQESMQTVLVRAAESDQVVGASASAFVPGGYGLASSQQDLVDIVGKVAPIFLMITIVILMMAWIWRKRSVWTFLPLLFMFAAIVPSLHGQDANVSASLGTDSSTNSTLTDIQATIDACRNYDLDNAVRHFGECAESYRMASEFSAMRQTAVTLIANIAPLVVANPDITPYKTAYASMVKIALSLFRVAWAFNSLYLILNIFNPQKRSEAIKQYIWLIVFAIFAYTSFSIVQNAILMINSVSTWVAGSDAALTLTHSSISAEFVAENYEMLQLMLPFLHLTWLVLLARYLTVIGMVLFFPFTLLLFFTGATRGFGRAALTVTFASLALGVLNAIFLLIYKILTSNADPAFAGTFASTFFSSSFIVFFGFVNLLVLLVAFLAGIIFIGQNRTEGTS